MRPIDTHAHIFQRGLKLANLRRYAPGYDARLSAYLDMLDGHGIAHGVLVQPSFLGTDNSYLVAGLRASLGRLRGIAVVDADISPERLREMDAAGVVGIRLNLVGASTSPDFSSTAWRTLLSHLSEFGWQVEVHREAGRLAPILAPLLDAGVNVVVDHFGRPDPTLGVDDPGFRFLLQTAASRRVWVKLSGAYRNGAHGRGRQVALDAIPLLRTAFGMDRLVWGSDWPHTQFEKTIDYGQTRHALDSWLPDPEERRIVLVDTPRSLFRFG
jgi:predicted TIM-barrel fold metal-dependent hydrolase